MAKDKNLLLGVSDLFTEKTLEEILSKVTGEKEINVTDWKFGDASAKGDSYLSTVNRVTVTGEAAGKVTRVSLVVKSLPKNLGRRKTFRSTEFFRNEINFYNEIVPKFAKFLEAKNQSNLLAVPRCLAAVTDGENDFLALEDVSVFGFGPVSRQSTLTLEQCRVILESLARFHAISFAYKDHHPEEFESMRKTLQETYYCERLWKWYDKLQAVLIRISKNALAMECPNSDVEKRFNSFERKEFFNKAIRLCERGSAPTSVITQGDCWAPNFLVRNGENTAALMLDFQLTRASSPILDISFFIYSCTSKTLRDDHYDELLKIYHTELTQSIAKLQSDPEKLYPWNVFMNEVKEQSEFGLIFCLEAVPFSIMDSSEAFDLDTIKGDQAIDITDIWILENIKTSEGRRRLVDIISHAFEHDYF